MYYTAYHAAQLVLDTLIADGLSKPAGKAPSVDTPAEAATVR
jgi:hypothetical protein